MKKKFTDNPVLITLLTAALLGAVAFWLRTENTLAVQGERIATLQVQQKKLADDFEELAKMIW